MIQVCANCGSEGNFSYLLQIDAVSASRSAAFRIRPAITEALASAAGGCEGFVFWGRDQNGSVPPQLVECVSIPPTPFGPYLSMAILGKGSRKIEVAGHELLWRIRRKPTYSQANAWSPMTIAVASASGRGSKLILQLDVTRPDAWMLPSAVSVTPADVARFVSAALADGWQPVVDGSSVVRKVTLTPSPIGHSHA